VIDTDERHPELLPWFADGRLDPEETAAIERHLARCAPCRGEVDALRSLYRSLRMPAESAHPSPEHLVAEHTPDVASHVAACDTCASDLRTLERADAASTGKSSKRVIVAAASLLLIVALGGWRLAPWSPTATIPHAPTRVEFASAQRGAEETPRLIGDGPWELLVWAPLGGTSYTVRIERSDDPGRATFEAPVEASSSDGSVVVLISQGRLRPGLHTLSLIPRDGDGSPNYERRFEVVRSP
jgi:putative zinc finger protein